MTSSPSSRTPGATVTLDPDTRVAGTYVVQMTIKAPEWTAYDVATQALLRPIVVTVPKPMDVQITAPAVLSMASGAVSAIPVDMGNTGTQPWGSPLYASIWADPSLDPALDPTFSSVLVLSANWLDPSTGAVAPAGAAGLPRSIGAPGNHASVNVLLVAPPTPGEDVLILSLTVQGDLGSFPQVPLTVPATITAPASPAGGVAPAPGAAAGATR